MMSRGMPALVFSSILDYRASLSWLCPASPWAAGEYPCFVKRSEGVECQRFPPLRRSLSEWVGELSATTVPAHHLVSSYMMTDHVYIQAVCGIVMLGYTLSFGSAREANALLK